MVIHNGYEGKYFGFASRNFYGEFLAACKVMKDASKYFDRIDYAPPQSHDTVQLSKPLYVSSLLNYSNVTREELRSANPALQSSVIFSKRPIPAGYELRFPQGMVADLPTLIARVREKEPAPVKVAAVSKKGGKSGGSSKGGKAYVVRRGDTLFFYFQKILNQRSEYSQNQRSSPRQNLSRSETSD